MTKQEFFGQVISENLKAGINRGYSLVVESLDQDLSKQRILSESSLDAIIDGMIDHHLASK